MYSKKLKFNAAGKFKIMQIADVQEGAKVSSDTLRLMQLALGWEKPDLVVFTGDQLYGVHPSFYIGDKRKNASSRKVVGFKKLNIEKEHRKLQNGSCDTDQKGRNLCSF